MDSFDLNIEHYQMDDLLDLLKLEDEDHRHITRERIVKTSNQYIEEFTNIQKPDYVDFFMRVQQKILDYLGDYDSIYQREVMGDKGNGRGGGNGDEEDDIDYNDIIEKTDDMRILFRIFHLDENELPDKDHLEDMYDTISKEFAENTTIDILERKNILGALTKKYNQLRKYIDNEVYGKQFTDSKPTYQNEVAINQNRYDLLRAPNVMQHGSNFVIQKNAMNTQDMYMNPYPADTMNPVRRKTITQVVSIDSAFRRGTIGSDGVYRQPLTSDFMHYPEHPFKNVISMKLVSAEIPNIWYGFSDDRNNNTFTITVRNFYPKLHLSGSPAFDTTDVSNLIPSRTYQITIPEGSYTAGEAISAMNKMFHNISPNAEDLSNNHHLTGLMYLAFDINPYTGHTVIRAKSPHEQLDIQHSIPVINHDVSSNPYYSPDFSFDIEFVKTDASGNPLRPMQEWAGWMMGFRQTKYVNVGGSDTYLDQISTIHDVNELSFTDNNKTGSPTYRCYLESEGAFGSIVHTYLFLAIDDYNNNFKQGVISDNPPHYYLQNNILARIPIDSGSFTMVVDDTTHHKFRVRKYFGPVTIDKMRIQLMDRFGRPVEFDGENFAFSLEITQIYS